MSDETLATPVTLATSDEALATPVTLGTSLTVAPRKVLRGYGESSLSFELRRFAVLWEEEFPNQLLPRRLADAMIDPTYGAPFAVGFIAGVMAGGADRLRAWYNDLEGTLNALLRFVKGRGVLELSVASGMSLYEFFAVKFDPKRPGDLSPEVEQALEELELIHGLAPIFKLLDALNDEWKTRSLLESLNLLATDIVASLISTTGDWVRRFLLLTGHAIEQGELLGRFLGEAVVELVRAFVEPPTLSMVELGSALGLTDGELTALTSGATP